MANSFYSNGDVNVVTNNRDTGRTATYTYDSLNRLITGKSTATSGPDCWGQTVPTGGYDRYGNLLTINSSQCSNPVLSLTVNTYNQVTNTGFSYDAAGNLTGDGLYTYAWNAEGHVTSAAGVTYTYDGDGQRVKKSSGTLYWDGLAESDTSGNTWTNEYIFFAGQRIARRDGSGNVFYYFADALGSSRIIVQAGQTAPCYDADFYLFGAEKILTNTCSQNFKFAAMEYDTESADYHTWFRQYTPNQGRWLSPDPLGGDVANPQSLDRYAYALNSPTNLVDPLGLKDCAKGNPQTHKPPPGCIPSQVPEMALLYGPEWQIYLEFYQVDLMLIAALPAHGFVPMPPGAAKDCPGCYTNPLTDEIWYPGNFLPSARAAQSAWESGHYWNPIDQAVNREHPGEWTFRAKWTTVCSDHMTVSMTTGKESHHVDTVNPLPLWPVLFGPPGTSLVWFSTFIGHATADVAGLLPSNVACGP